MNRRSTWSRWSVLALGVLALSVAGLLPNVNHSEIRAEDGKKGKAKSAAPAPTAGVVESRTAPTVPTAEPAIPVAPTPPASGYYAPTPVTAPPTATVYPAPGTVSGTANVSLPEVFLLRELKKRLGSDNLKKLIDALGD